ncbi:hypothetical protein BH24ACT19_BH24ACT19_13020 [soil metagenome]
MTLLALTNAPPAPDHLMSGLDVSDRKTPDEKDYALHEAEVRVLAQTRQLENPDARVALDEGLSTTLLQNYAIGLQGIATADYARFGRCFWELPEIHENWNFHQSTVG